MFKKLFFLLALISSLMADQRDSTLPGWVFSPAISGKLSAVGSCAPDSKGAYMQRTTALANARSALGQIIESKITVLHESMITNTPDGQSHWSMEEIRLRSHTLLEHSKQENAYVDTDGTLYVLLTLPETLITENVAGNIQYTVSEIEDSLQTDPFDPEALMNSGCYDEKTLGTIQTKSAMRNGRPLWFYTTKQGSIGIAKKQSNSSYAKQKQLAWALAKADYAKQQKSKTETEIIRQTTVTDGNSEEIASSASVQKSSQYVNRLYIKDQWMEPNSCDLYVLVN